MLINCFFFFEINHAITNTFTVSYEIEMCFYSRELFSVSRSLWTRRLRLLSAAACFWDCGFESLLEVGRLFLLNVVSFQVEISPTGQFLVQRSRSECGVFEGHLEDLIMRRAWPIRDCCATKKKFRYSHESTPALTSSKSVFCPHGVFTKCFM